MARRQKNRPKPWFILKLSVGLTIALIAYSSYVYIGKLCIPMIRREQSSLGSRTLGVVFLVVFSVLWLMMIWAYITVVFTPPGYAVKHLPRQPMSDIAGAELASRENSTPYSPPPLPRPPVLVLPPQISQGSSTRSIPPSSSSLTSPSNLSSRPTWLGQRSRGSDMLRSHSQSTTLSQPRFVQPSTEGDSQTAISPPLAIAERQRSANVSRSQPQSPTQSQSQTRSQKLPARAVTPQRKQQRYCETCGITKPPRAHHCKTCGTCVLRYDHHCPWIGQCVGAQNEKFFFVFLMWGALFCLWTFTTLIALNARGAMRAGKTVDPEQIVTIVISGMFSAFSLVMLSTHFVLISTNQTTVEHFLARNTKDREKAVLDEMHSFCAFRAKRRTRQAWDAEYGRIGREGNMWWLGNMRANWEQVFGPRTWTWFLPIGTTKDNGLEYPRNPRFNADGVWLPRKRWPPGLQ